MRPIPTSAKLRLNECLGGVECDSQPSSWVSLLLIHPPSAKDLQARTHHLLGTEYREETDDGSLNSRESFTEKGEEYLKEKTKKKGTEISDVLRQERHSAVLHSKMGDTTDQIE